MPPFFRRNADVLFVVALASLMLLWNLGSPMLWSDEAITAIYSRNTLRHGWPRAFDGRNLSAYGGGTSVGSGDLGAWGYPLLQFYVTAASFGLFGATTWAARFPHALLGVGTVALTFSVALKLSGNRRAAFVAALALALSPQFLRFARNCRYFSLTVFLGMLWLLLYLRLPERTWAWKRWFALGRAESGTAALTGALRTPGWAGAGLGLATVLFFHAHYLVAGAFCAAAAAAILLVRRDVRRLPALAPVGAAAALLCAAWWAYAARLLGDAGGAPVEAPSGAAWTRLLWYLRDLNYTGMAPAGVLLALAALWAAKRLRPAEKSASAFLLALMAGHVLLLALFSGEPVAEGTIDANIRYAAPLIPLASIVGAFAAAALMRWRKEAGAAFLALWLGTNLLSFCPPRPPVHGPQFRSFLGEFALQTFRLRPVPPTSTEAAVAYLGERARQDDLVFVWPDYRRDPLMFYLGDRLLFCGILPEDDERIVPNAEALGLPDYVHSGDVRPDWLVGFRLDPRGGRPDIFARAQADPDLAGGDTRVLRVWWDDLSRPELTRNRAFPPEPERPEEGVLIVERRR